MPEDERSVPVRRRLATKIVPAYIRRYQVETGERGALISTVDEALASLGKAPSVEPAPTPAVPVRQSATREYVICLECGWRGGVLRRHLASAHGFTPATCRARWNLPREHPLVAREYAERRAAATKQMGLGHRSPLEGTEAGWASSMPRRREAPRRPLE